MLTTALLAYLAAFICYFVQWTFGQPMIDQPLGVGLVAGIIFGDVTAGIIIGAALQAIFIGSVNVGGATSAIRWQERCSLCASWSCLAWSRA